MLPLLNQVYFSLKNEKHHLLYQCNNVVSLKKWDVPTVSLNEWYVFYNYIDIWAFEAMASLKFLEIRIPIYSNWKQWKYFTRYVYFYMDRKINVFECENVQTAFDSQRFFNLEIFRITKFICPILWKFNSHIKWKAISIPLLAFRIPCLVCVCA